MRRGLILKRNDLIQLNKSCILYSDVKTRIHLDFFYNDFQNSDRCTYLKSFQYPEVYFKIDKNLSRILFQWNPN